MPTPRKLSAETSLLPNRPRAYSYVRFSTPEQMRGDSFRRQTEAAERYAAAHGLDLQEATYQDLGVSAFRGANASETGHLREFLLAVEHEDIPAGSFLLVESLDRISRQKPRKAVRLLEEICEAGITVVTLNDGRVYSEDNLDNDSWSLMGAMMIAIRANEESETKAKRLRAAWFGKRSDAAKAGKPLTALCPGWLRLREDRAEYEVIPERASVVCRIFNMTLAGSGQHLIADTLNREGVDPFGRGKMWHRSYVKKLLGNPAVVGTFVPHTVERPDNGSKLRVPGEPIEGYFPAIIDRNTFEAAQGLGQGGARARPIAETEGGRSVATHMLAGLAHCPLCGSTMTRVFKGRKGGKPYLVCVKAKAGAGCRYRQVKVDVVEDAIAEKAGYLCAQAPSPDEAAQAELERLQTTEAAVRDQIENLLEAIERTRDSGTSTALVGRLRDNEAALEETRKALEVTAKRVADTLTNRIMNTAAELADQVEVYGPRNLPRVGSLMRQLFDRVEVDYPQGVLRFHWRAAPGETTSIMFAWPEDA